MPNWCSNHITIIGKRKDLIKIQDKMEYKDNPFSCEKVLPSKDAPANMALADYWGSKWDTCDTSLTGSVDKIPNSLEFIKGKAFKEEIKDITYFYNTAWSPVSLVIAELARQHPDVYIIEEFEEEGMEFRAIVEYMGGKEIRYLDLPLDEYDEETGENLENKEAEELIDSKEGYYDFASELFEKYGFKKYKPD